MSFKIKYNNRIILPILHVIVWGCFLIYPFLLYNSSDSIKYFIRHSFITRHLVSFAFLIIYFYANTFLFIPKLLVKKKILFYILVNVIIIALIILANVGVQYMLLDDSHSKYHWMYRTINGTLFSGLLVWGVSTGLKITGEWFKNEQLKKEMQNEKLLSELSFLKSQINPHFLFNSLNSIYALANKKSDDTADAVIKLSDMMRYMLYEAADDKVDLDKEIVYLNNYIELQKLRLNEYIKITFNVNTNLSGVRIEPMLLVPFVENAFKHGISYKNDSYITMDLKVQDGYLFFNVENSLHHHLEAKDKMHGIGLKNTKRRLDLLYPNKHHLNIMEKDDKFIVELKLQVA